MSEHVFFSTESRHNERLIRILSVGSLVSKPPTKEKRISIKVSMPLSTGGTGTGIMGAPEWLEAGYLFVAKHHDTVTPDIEFKGYCLEFSVANLFAEPVVTQDAMMRGFEIAEFGSEETPDVICSFTLRMGFSRRKWDWLGQFVGEDVWVKFTPGEAGTAKVEEEDGTLLDDGENDDEESDEEGEDVPTSGEEDETEEDSDLDTPEELVYEDGPTLVKGKSGPKDLAAFHEGQVEAEAKRGRGRPRKPEGFSKPLHQGNEF